MTLASDPTDITPPHDPAAYRRPRLLGVGFWALILTGLICVLAGYGLAVFGPRLGGGVEPAPTPPAPVVASPPPQSAPPVVAVQAPAPPSYGPDIQNRFDDLAAEQARLRDAASAALAAAALSQAAQGSGPFTAQVEAVRGLLPAADLADLHDLAATGAPTLGALTADYDAAADRASAASRDLGSKAGPVARALHSLSKVLVIRHVGSTEGSTADAILNRARQQVVDGDIDAALRTLNSLSPAARDAMADWRQRAARRAEIDRKIAALRAGALARITSRQGAPQSMGVQP